MVRVEIRGLGRSVAARDKKGVSDTRGASMEDNSGMHSGERSEPVGDGPHWLNRRCLGIATLLPPLLAAVGALVASAQPAAPGNLLATADDEAAVLTWSEPANRNIVRYEYRFGTDDVPLVAAWAEVAGSDADTVAHTVSGLANGSRYIFEVRAVDDDGAGDAARASTRLAMSPSAEVEVPDAELRERVEHTLGLAGGVSVTQGDMAKLTRLAGRRSNISDLTGLEFALNLVTLDLYGEAVVDLSPLAGLSSMTSLDLSNNAVTDVSPLSELTSLLVLVLSNNSVVDVLPLLGMASLVSLDLSGNDVADVSPLSGLASLTSLNLSANGVTDVSPLSGLTSLVSLDLSGNGVADVAPLSGLTALWLLFLSDNEIADVSPLSSLTGTDLLTLNGNKIRDVSPLSGMTSLTQLFLSDNAIVDVLPLSGMASLMFLHLSGNGVVDVSSLAGLTSLTFLDLSDNRVTDVSPLAELSELTVLDLFGNEVVDVLPLSGLTSLTRLFLSDNEIVDVSALSSLIELTTLYLDGNAISDISGLGELDELSLLFLGRNAVADIVPLLESGLPGAGNYADLRGNPLGDGHAEHVLALREAGAAIAFDDGGHRVPLFPSVTSGSSTMGFVRVINHSDEAGGVSIEAVDETGDRRGAVSLVLGAGQVLHFNAEDLEQGNSAKGLRGIGEASGDWRLVLRSDLNIEVLGYGRTPDGFVTSLHDFAQEAYGASAVPTFNPSSNQRQVSRLRLTNPTELDRQATLLAWDDAGSLRFGTVATPARKVVDITAAQLESGAGVPGLAGLRDGRGKWRMSVEAPGMQVMSLLQSPTGHLANISTRTAVSAWRARDQLPWRRGGSYRVPLFLAASTDVQGFLRVVNWHRGTAAVMLRAVDGAGVAHDPIALTLKGGEVLHLNSLDLEAGNAAKGLPGIGTGTGDWHLEVTADRSFEVLAYARTADGFVTSLHDVAPRAEDGSLWIPFFNPGSNRAQASRLRLVNWGETTAELRITGVDDAGRSPGEAVRVRVPARSARDYMAWDLETGRGEGLSGALGDGDGKWRLRVSSTGEIDAMSLLGLPTGHITNLSTTPRFPPE